MNIGTKIEDGKVIEAYLDFSSGKKVILTPEEWEEFEKKLHITEIAGKIRERANIIRKNNKEAKERMTGTVDTALKEMKL